MKILAVLLALFIAIGLMPPMESKAETVEGTATLRIFSTTDLHGQSITYSYDTASSHKNGSLAQLSTVIKEKTAELTNGNTLLVDCGDTIYGLGAQSILYGTIAADEQYMYELMAYMGYDAITLGNHDFDFGYDYEKKILEDSGLSDKVVVSNVTTADSGEYPWAQSMMVEKEVTTTGGGTATVKVGITGATIPTLSVYFTSWRDVLTTYDIVDSVSEQVENLQDMGADVIVVLAHSGFGTDEEPESKAQNVGYQLSQIEGVDVVCLGHTHKNYPYDNSYTTNTYSYDGVDAETGLVNGAVVVEEKDHGEALGITDLTLSVDSVGNVSVVNKEVEVQKITKAVEEDEEIVALNEEFNSAYLELVEKSEAVADSSYNSYFGMIEDNALIQLSNDAKIAHGKHVLAEKAPEYLDYPIIASTTYNMAGGDSASDYISTDGEIKLKDILNIQKYANDKAKIYYITGEQLKEALEWQASAYLTVGTQADETWEDETINSLVETGYAPILAPEWDDWEGLTIFDGIEYTIDPSTDAKYDRDGNVVNPDASRITSLTYNGTDVTDDQVFVWVTRITASTFPPVAEVADQTIVKLTEQMTTVIEDYIEEQSATGALALYADDNWHVQFPEGGSYIVKTSADSADEVLAKSWYVDTVAEVDGYAYYQAAFSETYEDTSGPLLVVTKSSSDKSGDPIEVYVQASDGSGVQSVLYAAGIYGEDDEVWSETEDLGCIGSFMAEENGIYTVRAEDAVGNVTVKYLNVKNIDADIASTPKIDDLTNLMTQVTGKAGAGATVEVITPRDICTGVADEDGYYTVDVSYLNAGDVVFVKQTDVKGRESVYATTTVTRAAANPVIIESIRNTQKYIKGKLNDSVYCHVVAIRGDDVYVATGDKAKYKKTSIYEQYPDKNIIQTDYSYNSETNTFSLYIPDMLSGQTIEVYSFDWRKRASNAQIFTVEENAPNKPVINEVVSDEKAVYGHVPEQTGECKVVVKDAGKKYKGTTDDEGYFTIEVDSLSSGDTVKVFASDTGETGKTRKSLVATTTAVDCSSLSKVDPEQIDIDSVNNKSTEITGSVDVEEGGSVALMAGGNTYSPEVDKFGDFTVALSGTLQVGSNVCVLIRNSEGEVEAFNYIAVELAKPDSPEFATTKVTTKTKKIVLTCVDSAEAVLVVGNKTYTQSTAKKKGSVYKYVFKLTKLKAGKKVYAYMKNSAGTSKKVVFGKVEKVKKVKTAKTGTTEE